MKGIINEMKDGGEMDLAKYIDYTVDDFLNHEGFWLWVLEGDTVQNTFWLQVLNEYPETQFTVEKAKQLVVEMNTAKAELSVTKVDALWNRILLSTIEHDAQ